MRSNILLLACLVTACGAGVAPRFDSALAPEVTVLPPRTEYIGPAKLVDLNPDPHVVEVNIEAGVADIALSSTRTVRMYAYNGQVPGPLLEATAGDKVIVHFLNNLPEPTTVHWHGLRIPDAMDGNPRLQNPIPRGGSFTYEFTVPEAGTFWYHPHVRANEQVEKGLQGTIIVRPANASEEPHFAAERFIVVDDVLLNGAQFVPFMTAHMEAMSGRMGNTLLVNGQIPTQQISVPKNRVERWRIVNTANARTMKLSLTGATWRVIGTDGGLLPKPYAVDRLEIAVGQRFEMEVTFANEGPAQLLTWVLVAVGNTAQEKSFPLIDATVRSDSERWPTVEWSIAPPVFREVVADATFDLDAMSDPTHGLMWMINGQSHPTAPLFTFTKGQVVRMHIVNHVGIEHPFHLHGQFFEVLDARQPGFKDVVLIPPNSAVDVAARLDNPGQWMVHCHILEHAELGMMGEIRVMDTPQR